MTMSDRIAVMNKGRYEQLGDPESLYERPETRFVAGFLGVSNLIDGTVEAGSDDYAVCRLPDDTRIRLPRAALNGSERVMVGVRPEKLRLIGTDATVPDGHNSLEGRIRDASYMGASTSYLVRARHGQDITVYEQNVERTSHGSLHRPGEDVRISWSPDHTFAVPADDTEPAEA